MIFKLRSKSLEMNFLGSPPNQPVLEKAYHQEVQFLPEPWSQRPPVLVLSLPWGTSQRFSQKPYDFHHCSCSQQVRSFWKQNNITFYIEPLLVKGNLTLKLRQDPFYMGTWGKTWVVCFELFKSYTNFILILAVR